jgi:hypothetical protein
MPIGFSVKVNTDDAFAKLDAYAEAVRNVALPDALNRLGEQARVAGEREIRKTYGLTIAQFSKYISVTPALRGGKLEYTIAATGKGFPLLLFKPIQTRHGVSVVLKGRRVVVPHAFIQTVGGNQQVWARGTYYAAASGTGTTGKGAGKRRKRGIREATGRSAFEATGERWGRFAFGRHHFPISLLRTTTPPSALMAPEVVRAMSDRIEEQMGKVINAAIKYATRA